MSNTYFTKDSSFMPFVEDEFVDRSQSFDPKISSTLTNIEELGNATAVGVEESAAKVAATLAVNEVGFQLEDLFRGAAAQSLAGASGVSILKEDQFSYGNMIVPVKGNGVDTIDYTYVLPKMTVQSVDYTYKYDTAGKESVSLQGTSFSRRQGSPVHERFAGGAGGGAGSNEFTLKYIPQPSSSTTGTKLALWVWLINIATEACTELTEVATGTPGIAEFKLSGVNNKTLTVSTSATLTGKTVKIGYITEDVLTAPESSLLINPFNLTSPSQVKGVYVVVTYGGTLNAGSGGDSGNSPSTPNITGGIELLRCQSAGIKLGFKSEDIGELGSQVREGKDVVYTATQVDTITGTLEFNESDKILDLLDIITGQSKATANEYAFSQFDRTGKTLHLSIRTPGSPKTILKEFYLPKVVFSDDGATGTVGANITKSYSWTSTDKLMYIGYGGTASTSGIVTPDSGTTITTGVLTFI